MRFRDRIKKRIGGPNCSGCRPYSKKEKQLTERSNMKNRKAMVLKAIREHLKCSEYYYGDLDMSRLLLGQLPLTNYNGGSQNLIKNLAEVIDRQLREHSHYNALTNLDDLPNDYFKKPSRKTAEL